MRILGQFPKKFSGRIYAYGYPDSPECGTTAASDPQRNVSFILPLGQCGVQMLAIDPVSNLNTIILKPINIFE